MHKHRLNITRLTGDGHITVYIRPERDRADLYLWIARALGLALLAVVVTLLLI